MDPVYQPAQDVHTALYIVAYERNHISEINENNENVMFFIRVLVNLVSK